MQQLHYYEVKLSEYAAERLHKLLTKLLLDVLFFIQDVRVSA